MTNAETAVRERYSAAAQAREEALCCPVSYDGTYLAAIPEEILERDYGCGDPTRHVGPGETVVDLGSGTGKACYILSQVVGPEGRVIGVDCNPEMLELSRRYRAQVAEKIGYANVEFRNGMIQDLRLDLDRLAEQLAARPVHSAADWLELRGVEDRLRTEEPMIADASVDCVVSNCVLNLVRQQDRLQLFGEIFRVLKEGGRAVISDIVCDRTVPDHLKQDPELWSGCISGAFGEQEFLQAFTNAGFRGIEVLSRDVRPWRTVEGIEFRSMTVAAFKSPALASAGGRHRVLYRGPFRSVCDDDGRTLVRGEAFTVDERSLGLLQRPPYAGMFLSLDPSGSGEKRAVATGSLPLADTGSNCCGPDDCC